MDKLYTGSWSNKFVKHCNYIHLNFSPYPMNTIVIITWAEATESYETLTQLLSANILQTAGRPL